MISCVDNDVWREELCVFYSWHFGNQLSVVSIVPYFVLKPLVFKVLLGLYSGW